MSRQHADNWSHPGHYLVDPWIHHTLVTKWSWSWSWMTYCHTLCAMSIGLPILRYSYFKFDHENPWSRSCVWSKVKVTFDLQNSKVKVMVKVKPIGHIWGQGPIPEKIRSLWKSDRITNFSSAHDFSIRSDSTNDPALIGSWSWAILLATRIGVG